MYLHVPISNAAPAKTNPSIWKWIVRFTLAGVAFVVVAMVVGYLYVRNKEMVESVYPNVTEEQLADIEERTGIVFPEGAVGLGYSYDHWTSIDPSLEAKVRIPSHQLNEFRSNKLLSPKSDRATILGDFPSWWKPSELTKIAEGEFSKDAAWVQWTLGTERDDQVIYIHWAIY
jgi:hypothetical protein